VLLTNTGGNWAETALLKLAIRLYRHRLRRVIAKNCASTSAVSAKRYWIQGCHSCSSAFKRTDHG
jgi:hypothetical protein